MKYKTPVLDRRITLHVIPFDEDGLPDRESIEDVIVWAGRRDTALALEEIGDSSSLISGTTVWTIHDRDIPAIDTLTGDDGRVYAMRSPADAPGRRNGRTCGRATSSW